MKTESANGSMTIGQVAGAMGVAATTLRYYEREGLLSPSGRSRAGYRLYDDRTVERLRFIRSAQAIGFALDDIRRLLELDDVGSSACRSNVQLLLERRLAEIDRKLSDLKYVRSMLARALNRCRASAGECAVLRELRPAKKRSRS
ncbi:MAG: heavy metal-responsive transcriptional regulator [Planctomycetes bacterium]|nr:heavy metal-responsive transcriptional regulator [Planctomycetota bacterium]